MNREFQHILISVYSRGVLVRLCSSRVLQNNENIPKFKWTVFLFHSIIILLIHYHIFHIHHSFSPRIRTFTSNIFRHIFLKNIFYDLSVKELVQISWPKRTYILNSKAKNLYFLKEAAQVAEPLLGEKVNGFGTGQLLIASIVMLNFTSY